MSQDDRAQVYEKRFRFLYGVVCGMTPDELLFYVTRKPSGEQKEAIQ